MSHDTTPDSKAQDTEQERIGSETVPRTTEEIAAFLEALALGQTDLVLARRLRDWAAAVERHGQEQLRVEAANVQGELYHTLEQHLEQLRDDIAAMRELAARRLDELEQRVRALEAWMGG